ncbi:hypothetical protein [Streptomyces sp. MZ04]|uniref:hypothetical protein n=1 Tax=Streptomyces sp. MZ04 TaxID=2559236 RepID=UPI0014331735|nr:hypothetical protein [Streptomyces sp. MZ04]
MVETVPEAGPVRRPHREASYGDGSHGRDPYGEEPTRVIPPVAADPVPPHRSGDA